MSEVTYSQGMTDVWSDGEKITVGNKAGSKWVKDNVEQIFGMGEWDKIRNVCYMQKDYAFDYKVAHNGYECISGYIPQRVIEDLASQPDPAEDELPVDVKKKNALDFLKEE